MSYYRVVVKKIVIFKGDQLREHRLSKGMTMKEASKAVGVSASFWCDIEHNRRSPSPDVADRIIKLMNSKPFVKWDNV